MERMKLKDADESFRLDAGWPWPILVSLSVWLMKPDLQLVASRPQDRQLTVRATRRALDDVGRTHTRREVHAGDALFATTMRAAVIATR